MTEPNALAYPELPAEDTGQQLRVWCGHCRAWHYHGRGVPGGAPRSRAAYGHRAAHCHRPGSPYRETGYVLVALDPLRVPARAERRRRPAAR